MSLLWISEDVYYFLQQTFFFNTTCVLGTLLGSEDGEKKDH